MNAVVFVMFLLGGVVLFGFFFSFVSSFFFSFFFAFKKLPDNRYLQNYK